MKKIFINAFIVIFFLFLCLPANAQISLQDIINDNSQLSDKQRMDFIKKIPRKEKEDLLINKLDVLVNNSGELNDFMWILYKLPKDSFNDKKSFERYFNHLSLATLNKQLFEYYVNRVNKPNFNIYYESEMSNYVGVSENNDKPFKAYDDFNNKLVEGTFNFDNSEDRKFYLDFLKMLRDNYWSYSDNNDVTEDNTLLMNVLSAYFKRPEFKDYKIKNSYNIYYLGEVLARRLNESSYEFILKKLQDKNTNLENLCYFLSVMRFDTAVSEEIEHEFDSGFYNPALNPLGEWREKHVIYLSNIDGHNNPIIQTINDNNIKLSAEDRIQILTKVQAYRGYDYDYNESAINDIKKVCSDTTISDKFSAIKKIIEKYYLIAKSEENKAKAESEKNLEKSMEMFNKALKKGKIKF